jgi:hypothetical protein
LLPSPVCPVNMPVTIEELDNTVRAFYEGRGEQQKAAQLALNQFKDDPDSWLMVDKILSDAQHPQTKCQFHPALIKTVPREANSS